jgi:hypothetical protein
MSQLENADFADTDVPFDVALPEGPYTTEAAQEEVRACFASYVCACGAAMCILDLPLS